MWQTLINFSSSFEKKDGFLSQIAKKKMKTEISLFSAKKHKQAMKVIDKMDAEFEFYSDEVKISKKLPQSYFTNFLHISTKEEIKSGIHSIFSDQSIVDTLKGDYVRLNSKIQDCLKMYYPSLNDESEVFKSNMQDVAGKPKPVRIFSIADIDFSQHKATFKIILIDPFHLVIPSDFGKMNSREMEKSVFANNVGNELCMSVYVANLKSQL